MIETPCIEVCVLDPVSGLCIGCGRTGAEIAGWLAFGAAERRAVMAALPARLKDLTAKRPRLGGRRARRPEAAE